MRNCLLHKNRIPFTGYALFQTLCVALASGAALLLNWMVDQISLSLQDGGETGLAKDFLVCAAYAALLGVLAAVSQRCKARCIRNACLHLKDDMLAGILAQSPQQFRQRGSASCLALMSLPGCIPRLVWRTACSIAESDGCKRRKLQWHPAGCNQRILCHKGLSVGKPDVRQLWIGC